MEQNKAQNFLYIKLVCNPKKPYTNPKKPKHNLKFILSLKIKLWFLFNNSIVEGKNLLESRLSTCHVAKSELGSLSCNCWFRGLLIRNVVEQILIETFPCRITSEWPQSKAGCFYE